MKLSIIKRITAAAVVAIMAISISACVKDKFSVPTVVNPSDPSGLHATMTFKDFKYKYCFQTAHILDSIRPYRIPDSIILSGVVNADDRTGNFYKQIVLQDSTGGIQIKIDATGLYNEYPVGRRIFIKCKGLYLYNYLGTLELGSYIDTTGPQPSLGGIPPTLLSTFVVKGAMDTPVVPKLYTIAQLNSADQLVEQSRLIQIDSVEFINGDLGLTYADPFNKAFGNITFADQGGYTAVVRSSGYANFAAKRVAQGSGRLTGIFTIYAKSNGTTINQIGIRDTTDVKFYNPRF
jgi:hypothetical protein